MSIDSQMAEVARIEMLLADEENKRAKWKTENIRRRHNYLPLIMELLRSLASRGSCSLFITRPGRRHWGWNRRRKRRKP